MTEEIRWHQGASPPGGEGVRSTKRDQDTILVVDDSEAVRSVTEAMLETFGYSVLTASDGFSAVEVFRAHANDIAAVLLDMAMPRMSGGDVFREMRQIRADVRVILTSGYSEQDARARFAVEGLAGFIQKPFRLETLEAKLREVLGGGA